jgi:ABC-type glycerol-3-phosphate transport system substrate-binding protein
MDMHGSWFKAVWSPLLAVVVLGLGFGSVPLISAQGPVEVLYLSTGTTTSEHAWNAKWIAEFNKARSDIRIKMEEIPWTDLLTKVAAYHAAGIPPDIAWYASSQILEWQVLGLLEPLDEWLGDTKKEFLPSILDPKVSDVIFDGKMMGVPFTYVGRNLAVRADVLRAAGVNPVTLNTWEGVAKALKASTKPPSRYGTYFPFADALRTAGAAEMYFRGFGLDGIFDVRPEKKANYIKTLQYIKNDVFPSIPPAAVSWRYVDVLQAYVSGLITVHPTGSYLFGELQPSNPEVMNIEKTKNLPFPMVGNPKGILPMYTVGYVMFKASKKKKEAAEVLKFFTRKQSLLEWPMNMVPKSGTTVADRIQVNMFGESMRWYLRDWDQMMRTATLIKRVPYTPSGEINNIFRDALLKMYQGRLTPEQAYDEISSGVRPLLKYPRY